MAGSVEYDIVPDYDKLLDLMTAAKRARRLTRCRPNRCALRVARARASCLDIDRTDAAAPGHPVAAAAHQGFGSSRGRRRRPRDRARASSSPSSGRRARGKTTLLRMLAGMETPTAGDILLRGKRINDVPANRRPTCMVFQSLALFPHRTVGENIEFPLKIKGVAPASAQGAAPGADAACSACPSTITAERAPNARAASGSASRWPARSPSIPRSCSSTSRCRRSTTSSERRSRRS